MATPLHRLCLQTRSSHRSLGACVSVSKQNVLARQFHTTQYRRRRKNEEDEDLNAPNPYVGRKEKRRPVNPSEIDVPRATSTRQLLEAFGEDEIEQLENEQNIEKYTTFLSQYGAAVSPEHPAGYDEFHRRYGFDLPDTKADSTNESQILLEGKRREKMVGATLAHLQQENPVTITVTEEDNKPGLVSFGDEVDEHSGPDELFEGDDITALGHGYLEQHREIREYYRLAAWELPLLTQYAKPFELPNSTAPLRFRYTSYMGEEHPSEKKVVVEFCTADLPLTPQQRRKLVKLLGQRYNPQKDVGKISCESFPDPQQNKRYLSDLVDTLLAEARLESDVEGAKDSFDDVPPDFRHVKWKKQPKFPDAWKMTPDRRSKLYQGWTAEIGRAQQALLSGKSVNGEKTISHFLGAQPVATPLPVKVK